ncbi:MAG: AzlD domain-containing protein [Phascolarctobacterium sp.]|nr:AzlD domain-containing protein [Phascolarctobacterium sp.]
MPMTWSEIILAIAVVMAGTMLTRFLSFIVFREQNALMDYLSTLLPAAAMAMLVVYSFKDVNVFTGSHGIPEAIAGLLCVLLQIFFKNVLLSMAAGTVCYMYLVQYLFV